MRQVISLNGTWKLKGTASYVPLRDSSMETGKPLEGITQWLDAEVPGGVTRALYNAGWIEHPYVDMNSLKCEWVENRWWIYRKEFEAAPLAAHQHMKLYFDGVDYECMVYLNNKLLGTHTGMYERFSFDITEQCRAGGPMVLEVLILHAPDEMGQLGRTSLSSTQKSRFNYKWDFSTRLVNLGIWQGVSLVTEDEAAIGDLYVHSDVLPGGEGVINVQCGVVNHAAADVTAEVCCAMNGHTLATVPACMGQDAFTARLLLPEPELWYPNGIGAQPLYDVTITLRSGDTVLDRRCMKQGVRHFELVQNDPAPAGAMPYTVMINGVRV